VAAILYFGKERAPEVEERKGWERGWRAGPGQGQREMRRGKKETQRL
jgi:hypothetical protein